MVDHTVSRDEVVTAIADTEGAKSQLVEDNPAQTRVRLEICVGNRTIPDKALIDTGNLIRNGLAVSLGWVRQHGLPFKPCQFHIGTARRGAPLTVMGRLKDVTLRIGTTLIENCVALIIDKLSTPINIGMKLLADAGAELRFTSRAGRQSTITVGASTVPLIQVMTTTDELDATGTDVQEAGVERQGLVLKKERELATGPAAERGGNKSRKNPSVKYCLKVGRHRNFVNVKRTRLGSGTPVYRVNKQLLKLNPMGKPRVGVIHECAETMELSTVRGKVIGGQSVCVLECRVGSSDENRLLIPNQIPGNVEEGIRILPGLYAIQEGIARIGALNQTEEKKVITTKMRVQATVCKPTLVERQVMREMLAALHPNAPDPGTTPPQIGAQMEQLFKELRLDESEVLRNHPKVLKKLKDQLVRLRKVFTYDEMDVGYTDVIKCEVKLKPGTTPIRQKDRPMNPKLEEDLHKQLQNWLKKGVVEASKSPWSSPLVPVKKKDGTTRWAIDLRLLNRCVVGDSYPLPRIEQLLERAAGHQIYSSLDAAAAYFTVPMAEEAKELTAFSTPFGLYHFRQMPFGLCTAPAVYSRFIQLVLNPLGTRSLGVYLDDILLWTNTCNSHLEKLVEVLEAHLAAGIKLKPAKTHLFQKSVDWLGHRLSEAGVEMIPSYVEKILSWPRPATSKQLSTFIGFASYYRMFLRDFAVLMAPLTAQKKAKQLSWSAECELNFRKLKEQFGRAPIRAAPRYDTKYPFKLTTDYSGTALAAVLSQEQGGAERMIAAVGRKATCGERNYPSWKGELASLVFGVRKFHHILSFAPFIVVTDAAALKHLHTLKNTRGITGRWLAELAGYQMTVVHKAGKLNKNADSLSRAEHLEAATRQEEEEQEEYVHAVEQEDLYPDTSITRPMIRQAQHEDEVCKQVMDWLDKDQKPASQEMRGGQMALYVLRQQYEQLSVAPDGVLMINRPVNEVDQLAMKIVLPEELRPRAFYHAHTHATAGHFGVRATLDRMKRWFYYPTQQQDVENRIKLCQSCIQKSKKIDLKDATHKPHRWGFPLEMLFVDLVGPLPKSVEEFSYILSVQDAYSRYVNLYPLRSKTSEEVTRTLVERWVGTFGCPVALHSDQGKEFTSQVWSSLMEKLEIKNIQGPAYNPQSNSVERFHRTLHTMMRTVLEREDKEWPRLLSALQLAYNSKVNVVTGVTPLLAFTGREARLPLDLMVSLPRGQEQPVAGQVQDIVDRMKRMYNYIRKTGEAVIRRNAALYSGKKNGYRVDQFVWYLCPRSIPGKPEKWSAAWTGPFRVTEIVSEVLLKIQAVAGLERLLTVHISRIRPYIGDIPVNAKVPKHLDLRTEDVEGEEVAGGGTERANLPHALGVPVKWIGSATTEIVDKPKKIPPIETAGRPPIMESRTPEAGGRRTPPVSKQTTEEPSGPSPLSEPMVEAPPVQEDSRALTDDDLEMTEPQEELRDELEPEIAPAAGSSMEPTGRRSQQSSMTLRSENSARKHKHSTTEYTSEEFMSEDGSPANGSKAGSLQKLARRTKKKKVESKMRALLNPNSTESSEEEAMMMITIPIQSACFTPARQTTQAAGYDLESGITTEIPPGSTIALPTGLQMELPEGYFGKIESRSGMALAGLITVGGVIDSDFRGEVKVLLYNNSGHAQKIKKGDRIAQLVLLPLLNAEMVPVDQLTATQRGTSGFGSTGQ